MRQLRRLLHCAAIIAIMVVGAEIAARLDDAIRLGIPFRANPLREYDLVEAESWGVHGRPHGQYRKWKLNAFGFRAPPMQLEPDSQRPRLVVLGASESFGLYEDLDKEYPAQLAQRLSGPFEVVNAAMAGITVKRMIPYWEHWVGNFGAKQVLLYPSPMLYLDDEPPSLPTQARPVAAPTWHLRFGERVKDVYHTLPNWVRACREDWVVQRRLAEHPTFDGIPTDRLRLFRADLDELLRLIRARGVEPILMTHASSATRPHRPEDETYLRRMRMFFPGASAEVLVEFERQANDDIRALALQHKIRLIDVDAALTGRSELFADLVHFNNDGAAQLAELLAKALQP